MLNIGSIIQVIGFADGNQGSTVTDAETIVIESAPMPVLDYEKSFFIAAEDGLRMDLRKVHGKCPNAHTTEKSLTTDDLDRLSCSLLSISKEFITELPRGCQIEPYQLAPGTTYLVELQWFPREEKSEAHVEEQAEMHLIKI